ncbi:MAG: peptide chain release factor-like protein [Planctomycetes bacterium]|nr:peptide chain release factor-like protein [Planctomycetota bacterium]MBL7008227.1 peptide chain release factor-like protein [Planctomycetota bacterium]
MEDRSRIHPACLPEEELRKALRTERTRGSGPGGQHRNKVETEIRLTHLPTGIHAFAGERRSQHQNNQVAYFRLRLNLALGYRRPLRDEDFVPPGAFEPSPLWLGRVRGGRIAVNPQHDDFPAVLAEALDALNLYEDDLAAAAEALRVTRSQLVKLLAKAPAALHALNQRRQARGDKPLRA